jgi:hypothetical protein
MASTGLSRTIVWGFVFFLALAILIPSQGLPAQSTGCTAVDKYDQPRACTFLEEHGACLWNALDSYDTCQDLADGFFDRVGCELGVQVDLLACNLSLPWRILRTLLE